MFGFNLSLGRCQMAYWRYCHRVLNECCNVFWKYPLGLQKTTPPIS